VVSDLQNVGALLSPISASYVCKIKRLLLIQDAFLVNSPYTH
jgi:hypothetical protein